MDIEQNVRIELLLDLYPKGAELTLQPGRYNYDSRLTFEDSHDRRLQLTARVEAVFGGAIRVSILAQHWLVNKTGLPVIFRQEGMCMTNIALKYTGKRAIWRCRIILVASRAEIQVCLNCGVKNFFFQKKKINFSL